MGCDSVGISGDILGTSSRKTRTSTSTAVSCQYIDSLTAKLLLSVNPPGNTTAEYEAATGVYFPNLRRGEEFNLIGRGLTLEQQRVAVAIFRSIRH